MDGSVPMTNNAAEQSIRPFTQGRKNWYLIDTVGGAKSSAVAYSIVETAKANNLKPYEYFKFSWRNCRNTASSRILRIWMNSNAEQKTKDTE